MTEYASDNTTGGLVLPDRAAMLACLKHHMLIACGKILASPELPTVHVMLQTGKNGCHVLKK